MKIVSNDSCLLHAFRMHDIELLQRTQESMALVPAQDVEMDCFGFEATQ